MIFRLQAFICFYGFNARLVSYVDRSTMQATFAWSDVCAMDAVFPQIKIPGAAKRPGRWVDFFSWRTGRYRTPVQPVGNVSGWKRKRTPKVHRRAADRERSPAREEE